MHATQTSGVLASRGKKVCASLSQILRETTPMPSVHSLYALSAPEVLFGKLDFRLLEPDRRIPKDIASRQSPSLSFTATHHIFEKANVNPNRFTCIVLSSVRSAPRLHNLGRDVRLWNYRLPSDEN